MSTDLYVIFARTELITPSSVEKGDNGIQVNGSVRNPDQYHRLTLNTSRATGFNMYKSCTSLAQCIYMFCLSQLTLRISLNNINQMVFKMETGRVYYWVRTEFLYIT
jgi:hypothetical protein